MYYSNELVDELEKKVKLNPAQYANIQAHNVVKMLKLEKSRYKMFGVYWWAVKDALRKYIDNGQWYCGKADDLYMKEKAWHGSEYRTMIAAMYHSNECMTASSACEYFDKNGERHLYTLHDSDAGL